MKHHSLRCLGFALKDPDIFSTKNDHHSVRIMEDSESKEFLKDDYAPINQVVLTNFNLAMLMNKFLSTAIISLQ